MADDNLIIKNWLEQEAVFNENLAICRQRPTIKAIHDIRVSVKKMRSYLRLKDLFDDKNWKDEFSSIAIIFKSTGRLRDLDKSLHVLRDYERKHLAPYPFLKEYLLKTRTLIRSWVRKEATQFTLDTTLFKDQLRSLSVPDSGIIEKIIEEACQKVKKIRNLGHHIKKNAHEIRKQLKDVYYWIKICPENSFNNSIDVKALDKFIDELGHWQDHFVLRKKLRLYRKELALPDEKDQLKALEKNVELEQEKILHRAKKQLQEVEIKKAT